MLCKPREVLDLIGVASGVHCHRAGVGQGLGAESAGQGMEDLGVGGGERGVVCGAGGASAGWAEGGGILGSRPWEAESFPAVGGRAQQAAAGARADEWASSSLEPLPLITEVFLHKQVEVLIVALTAWEGELHWVRENRDAAWVEKEALEWARNTSVRVATERAPEVWGLCERLMQWEVWPAVGVEEWGMALEGGSLGAELEAVRWREDWLVNEAASGHAGILCWVWEH
ncbi:hypothetical protein C0989_006987 [Termitomyces sp. Mn162]|nr:hypothetical protein C0989_006987 [Termitomyces sp. Mn162]